MVITIQKFINKMQLLKNITTYFMLFFLLNLAACGNDDLCVGEDISRVSSPDKIVDVVVTKAKEILQNPPQCLVHVSMQWHPHRP